MGAAFLFPWFQQSWRMPFLFPHATGNWRRNVPVGGSLFHVRGERFSGADDIRGDQEERSRQESRKGR